MNSESPRRAKFSVSTNKHEDRGDQADHAAAEGHRTIDVTDVLQLLRSDDESVSCKVLQRVHVKCYHCEIERLQSLLRVAGTSSKAVNLVLQVV